MKSIFENVIKSGSYDLDALLKRIDTYHIEDKLTDDDREALYAMARTAPKPQYDYSEEIPALWAAIGELKDLLNPPETDPEVWAEFVQPTGAHDAYGVGDQVTFVGKRYVCQMDGCAWSPSTYPAAWEEQAAAPVEDGEDKEDPPTETADTDEDAPTGKAKPETPTEDAPLTDLLQGDDIE